MEIKVVELNDYTIELIDLMSKGLITIDAVNIIIEALENKQVEATYKTNKTITEHWVTGVRTIYTNEMEEKSNIENLAYNFHGVMIKEGEENALRYLKKLVEPAKKTYRKYRRY